MPSTVTRPKLHTACLLAWRAGDAGRTFEQAITEVREFLGVEPDASVETRLPDELRAAWERGVATRVNAEMGWQR